MQQIKSCRRQLYRPKKLTLARLKVCFGFRSNRFRSMEHDTSKTREEPRRVDAPRGREPA